MMPLMGQGQLVAQRPANRASPVQRPASRATPVRDASGAQRTASTALLNASRAGLVLKSIATRSRCIVGSSTVPDLGYPIKM
jgi:hypothetical protein